MRPKMTAVRIGLVLAMVFAASMSVTVPTVHAIELFLAGDNIDAVTTRVPGNDLVFSPPPGPLTVIEPNTTEGTTAIWRSAPLADAVVLLPGNVTLDLLVKNYQEFLGDGNDAAPDVCFSKRINLAGVGVGPILVAEGCFENPLPPVGNGTCPPTFVMGQHPPAAGCVPQGVMTMV